MKNISDFVKEKKGKKTVEGEEPVEGEGGEPLEGEQEEEPLEEELLEEEQPVEVPKKKKITRRITQAHKEKLKENSKKGGIAKKRVEERKRFKDIDDLVEERTMKRMSNLFQIFNMAQAPVQQTLPVQPQPVQEEYEEPEPVKPKKKPVKKSVKKSPKPKNEYSREHTWEFEGGLPAPQPQFDIF